MDHADNMTDHGFADNWDYLRTELRWLDQVLMMAIARQKKETQEVDRVAQSRADRVTSHWWRGIVTIEGNIAYDEHRQPQLATAGVKGNYQQQLEARIQASQQRGIVLGLPLLRDRLQLSGFEKNLVLMSLAPEVNRRYAKLYRFLQGEDAPLKTDLPTLDLVMRLMCRNDAEWRTARSQLTAPSPLFHYHLVQLLSCPTDTFLNQPLRLSDELLRYLLAEKPTVEALSHLLRSTPQSELTTEQNALIFIPPTLQLIADESIDKLTAQTPPQSRLQLPPADGNRDLVSSSATPTFLTQTSPAVAWTDLVLSTALLKSIKAFAQRVLSVEQITTQWGFALDQTAYQPGSIALFSGAAGTGKTFAAEAIAHHLQTPLYQVDLAMVEPHNYAALLAEIEQHHPLVLLIKSAHLWFDRATFTAANLAPAPLSLIKLRQFFTQRLRTTTLTILSETLAETAMGMLAEGSLETDLATQLESVQVSGQSLVKLTVDFPLPNKRQRLKLWQRTFPVAVPLATDIDWALLAGEAGLSGGEIRSIAYEAALHAASIGATKVSLDHILWAIDQWASN